MGILSILKALGPIAAEALSFAGMRKSAANLKTEERIKALEEELARAGELVGKLAHHAQAIAEELQAQAVANAAREKKIMLCLILSGAAFCLGLAALLVAFGR